MPKQEYVLVNIDVDCLECGKPAFAYDDDRIPLCLDCGMRGAREKARRTAQRRRKNG